MLQSVTQKLQNESFINLNDVLLYINNANQTEKRCIQIALNNRMHIHAVNPVPVKATGMKSSVWDFKFYFLNSFRITSLNRANKTKVIELCALANYRVLDIQFIRKSFHEFEMYYKGETTFYSYDLRTNEID